MNIMNIKEALGMINKRGDVLETKCNNTTKKNPDYYKALKELKMTQFIKELLMYKYPDDTELYGSDEEFITNLFVARCNPIQIDVNEGDNVLELLDKYKDVKNIYQKIKEVCEKKGLVIKGSDIVRQ